MKKKIIASMLALMTTLSFAGCGQSADTAPTASSDMTAGAPAVMTESATQADTDYYYEPAEEVGYAEDTDGAEYPEAGYEDFNTEEYLAIKESGFVKVADAPLSTFAADVDTGSYCNLRRLINEGDALVNVESSIRTEEIINYFDYTVDDDSDVFSIQYELG